MKLGLGLDLYRGAQLSVPVDQVRRAESLGFHSVWTAEAYGSDALSPLAYLAGLTSRIKLATGVVQTAARAPAATAMHAMTIDALAGGGRVIIGLGVSGPQIVEGWYGRPWGSPNEVLHDYVTIMRKVLDRDGPVAHDGSEYRLPYDGPGSVGLGKPLKSILHPHPGIKHDIPRATIKEIDITVKCVGQIKASSTTPHHINIRFDSHDCSLVYGHRIDSR